MNQNDPKFFVDKRDPRDHRLDTLNAQPLGLSFNGTEHVLRVRPSEAELVAIAHAAYVEVPNEEHQARMKRVVRAIRKALCV